MSRQEASGFWGAAGGCVELSDRVGGSIFHVQELP